MTTVNLMNVTPKFEGTLTVSLKAANDEAKAVLDLVGIAYRSTETGIEIDFPESLQVFCDADGQSQASFYVYQVGKERFVYPLDTDTLVIE